MKAQAKQRQPHYNVKPNFTETLGIRSYDVINSILVVRLPVFKKRQPDANHLGRNKGKREKNGKAGLLLCDTQHDALEPS